MACNEGFTFLPTLSYDAMLEVLNLLSVQDLGRLAQVSRESNFLADDDVLWRRMCRNLEQDWVKVLNKDVSQVPKPQCEAEWKGTFQQERDRLNTIAKFVGTWNEKWCDVNVPQSTLIESDGHNFFVTYKKNKFTASFQSFDGETLTFHLEGGDSGWSFVYKVKSMSDGPLHLTVYRIHDQKSFSGIFTRA